MAAPPSTTPVVLPTTASSPPAKPAFDALRWEKVSKLTPNQLESITAISKLTSRRPIPEKFHGANTTKPAPDSNQTTEKFDDVYQFNQWYSTLESENSQDAAYNEYLEKLKAYSTWTDEIIQNTEGAINFVTEIENQYSSVTTKTAELHKSCQELVAQEEQLVKRADSIAEKLTYFNELEQMTKKFYSPSLSVLEERFLPLLRRLDDCIDFIGSNTNYKEADTYLIKFRLIQNRAMTLIKNHVVASLKATTNQILSQMEAAPNPLHHTDAVYFVKYKALAQKLKPMCQEIETRIAVKEYGSLLEDCQYCYLQQRRSLLINIVYNHTKAITALPDLRDMVTNGCTYMLDVCHQETVLYLDFFSGINNHLLNLLEEFSTILYETIRPIYIQVRVIDVLCGVVEMLRSIVDQINQKGQGGSAFKPSALRMLEDIQERLTYLAQTYIRDEIRNYHPLREDLDYPNKLLTAQVASPAIPPEVEFPPSPAPTPDTPTSATTPSLSTAFSPSVLSASTILATPGDLSKSAKVSVDNSLRALLQISMKNIYATCYPTLQRTTSLLTKLYLAVDMKVFEGLAHEAVSACTETLMAAGRMIAAQKTQIDSHLFVIKHLLVLSTQLTYFDISFAVIEKQVDFSQFKHSIRKILTGQAGGSLFSLSFQNPLLAVVQSPRVLDSQIDTKEELKKQYWATVDSFVNYVSKFAVQPITDFIAKVDQFLNSKNAPVGAAAHIANQPFLRPDLLDEALLQLTNNLHKWLGGANGVVSQLYLYLPHSDVTNLLLLIRNKITDSIDQMRTLMNTHYATHTHLQIISSEALAALFELWWSQDNNNTNNNNNNDNKNNNEINTSNNINNNTNTNNHTINDNSNDNNITNNDNTNANNNAFTNNTRMDAPPALTNDLMQTSASIPSVDAPIAQWEPTNSQLTTNDPLSPSLTTTPSSSSTTLPPPSPSSSSSSSLPIPNGTHFYANPPPTTPQNPANELKSSTNTNLNTNNITTSNGVPKSSSSVQIV